MSYDVETIRKDFPMLQTQPELAYLDSAASSQTPVQVLDAVEAYYRECRANVHRGMYAASEEATERYEAVRGKIAALIGGKADEIVFTAGTTAALNIAASAVAMTLKEGDEVVLSAMEHHANLVPWQQAAARYGLTLRFIPVGTDFRLDMDEAARLITERTKVLAVMHASNVLGTVNDVRALADKAHAVGATVIVDAAQTVGHTHVDVRELGADMLAFSGHKMFGPTGIGVLWGRKDLLDALGPTLFGGDMIREVYRDRSTWNDAPWKFEPGTPNIAGAIGLGAAVDYIAATGLDRMIAHEHEMTAYALDRLKGTGVTIHGPATTEGRIGAISFSVGTVHPHDVVTVFDRHKIAVRGGHHCAMPLVRDLGVPGTVRASMGPYVRKQDIDRLADAIDDVKRIFRI